MLLDNLSPALHNIGSAFLRATFRGRKTSINAGVYLNIPYHRSTHKLSKLYKVKIYSCITVTTFLQPSRQNFPGNLYYLIFICFLLCPRWLHSQFTRVLLTPAEVWPWCPHYSDAKYNLNQQKVVAS